MKPVLAVCIMVIMVFLPFAVLGGEILGNVGKAISAFSIVLALSITVAKMTHKLKKDQQAGDRSEPEPAAQEVNESQVKADHRISALKPSLSQPRSYPLRKWH
jgi:hypothetical protein